MEKCGRPSTRRHSTMAPLSSNGSKEGDFPKKLKSLDPAFSEYIKENHQRHVAWLRKRYPTLGQEDIKDFLQHTYVSIVHTLRKNDEQFDAIDYPDTYCFKAIHRTAGNLFRDMVGRQEVPFTVDPIYEPESDDLFKEIYTIAEKTFSQDDMLLFRLKYVYGYNSNEIADAMSFTSPAAARKRLMKIMDDLREALNQINKQSESKPMD
jgi:DNA-directed RNA polymerase specialized sigma24 family protein